MEAIEIKKYADRIVYDTQRTILYLKNGSTLSGYFKGDETTNELKAQNNWIFVEIQETKPITLNKPITLKGEDILKIEIINLFQNQNSNTEIPIVNNFRLLRIDMIMPPYLAVYKKILDYQVFRSTYNINIFVVYDKIKNYYVFEDLESEDYDKDLAWNIKTFIIKTSV